jgi:hypothetical protein
MGWCDRLSACEYPNSEVEKDKCWREECNRLYALAGLRAALAPRSCSTLLLQDQHQNAADYQTNASNLDGVGFFPEEQG